MGPEKFSRSGVQRPHDMMPGYVERRAVPGVLMLVSRRGAVHVNAIGHRTLYGTEVMQRDTILRIASMTKPVNAAAAMMLQANCKRSMFLDPHERYLLSFDLDEHPVVFWLIPPESMLPRCQEIPELRHRFERLHARSNAVENGPQGLFLGNLLLAYGNRRFGLAWICWWRLAAFNHRALDHQPFHL